MQVKYLDLAQQFSNPKLWQQVQKQLEQAQFILGEAVSLFEQDFAKLCGSQYAIAVNSGHDALFLAMKALKIGQGDEVITAPNSFIASAGAIVATGAKPIFVDVAEDYNINPNLLEQAINKHTKAIMPVHLTGNPANMPMIMDIAKHHKLAVIEDAAQAVMATIEDQCVGAWGDAGCFSLHPLKNLNIGGDGGVITTNLPEINETLRLLRNHGLKNRDEIAFFGYNSRLDSVQAAIARFGLEHLAEITSTRREHAQLYDEGLQALTKCITFPPRNVSSHPVFHTYVIQVEEREALMRFLEKRGIESKIHYPIPIHLQTPCYNMGYRMGDFPVCERQAKKIVSLPVHQYLTKEQILYVINNIKEFYIDR